MPTEVRILLLPLSLNSLTPPLWAVLKTDRKRQSGSAREAKGCEQRLEGAARAKLGAIRAKSGGKVWTFDTVPERRPN